jgi:hypothetical protein
VDALDERGGAVSNSDDGDADRSHECLLTSPSIQATARKFAAENN